MKTNKLNKVDSETVFLFDQVYRSNNKNIYKTAEYLNISLQDAEMINAILNDDLDYLRGSQLTIFDLLET
jgi:hypothetical protein